MKTLLQEGGSTGRGTETGLSPKALCVVAAVLFLPLFLILTWAAAPSVTFHDSGEFVLAATSGGISHAPGAPIWTLLAHIFLKLFRFADPAHGTNVFSALWGATTLALLAVLTAGWIVRLSPGLPRWGAVTGGLVSATTLLCSPAFIEQAATTKNYTLNTTLIVVFLLVGGLFAGDASISTWQARTRSFLLGLVYGLAVCSHTCLAVLGLPALLLLGRSACRPAKRMAYTLFVSSGIGLVAGLSVFAWIPLRAATHPLLNHGHVESAQQLWHFISRQQWAQRSLAEAPSGFIPAWLASYDFLGQLGWLGVVLALFGIFWMAFRKPFLLVCLVAAIIPYAGGMLLGHLRQAGIDTLYIDQYGASTFHLPIYLALSLLAGIGLAGIAAVLRRLSPVIAGVIVTGVLLVSGGMAGRAVSVHSMRDYAAPDQYVRAVLAPLPKDAIILAHTDNLTHLLAYHVYGPSRDTGVWLGYDFFTISADMQHVADGGQAWSAAHRLRHLKQIAGDSPLQPFTLPQLSEERLTQSPLFTEYNPEFPKSAAWLLPAGFLFEVKDHATSDDDVRRAEASWRRDHPTAWRRPWDGADRMEREAWALLFMRRGAFFAARGFWPEADESYRCSLAWYPADGNLWFCLAETKERQGLSGDLEPTYRQAIRYAPRLPGPRWNLAILLADRDATAYQRAVSNGTPAKVRDQERESLHREIRRLLVEEQRLAPNNPRIGLALRQIGE
jgi:tetratricopeptide (TPR) repeat protein